MNKTCYRIIFNKARGMLMAVAETAKSQSKARGQSSSTTLEPEQHQNQQINATSLDGVWHLKALMASMSLLVAAGPSYAQIAADVNAANENKATIGVAGNGVPVIGIQTPNAAGISRNVYSQFDVLNNGVVLNNSRTGAGSQLAGSVGANPYIATGEARVIVNEINASSASRFEGNLEVAGRMADVIIANPAGINVKGGGFINANKATLTTGKPSYNADGSLNRYDVTQGVVKVEAQPDTKFGLGGNNNNANYTEILARAVALNAEVQANQDINIVTGANSISADLQTITAGTATGTKPTVAIDVKALGGMYANNIYLVGTESGLGVRQAGTVSANANLVVSSAGRIENSGTLASTGAQQGLLSLSSSRNDTYGDINNTGTISGRGLISIDSGNNLSAGNIRLEADQATPLIINAKNTLTVAANALVQNTTSGGDIYASAGTISVGTAASIASNGNTYLDSTGNITLASGSSVKGRNDVNLAAQKTITATSAQLISELDGINIQASNTDLNSDTASTASITLTSSVINAAKDLKLYADHNIKLTNLDFSKETDSTLARIKSIKAFAGNDLSFTASTQQFPQLTGELNLQAGNQIDISSSASSTLSALRELRGANAVQVIGKTLNLRSVKLSSTGDIDLSANGGDLSLGISTLLNSSAGNINISTSSGQITTTSLNATATTGNLNLISGNDIKVFALSTETAVAGTDLKNKSSTLTRLSAGGDINLIANQGSIYIDPAVITSTSGSVAMMGKGTVQTFAHDNRVVVNDNGNYRHNIAYVGATISGNAINISSKDWWTHFDLLNANARAGDLTINSLGVYAGNITLKASQDINIYARQEGVMLLESNATAGRNLLIETPGAFVSNNAPGWAPNWLPSKANTFSATGLLSFRTSQSQDYRFTNLKGSGINLESGQEINWFGQGTLTQTSTAKALNIQSIDRLYFDPSSLTITAAGDVNLYSNQADVNLMAGNDKVMGITTTSGGINVSGRSVTLSGTSLIASKDVNVIAENGHILLDNAVSLTSTTKNVNVAASKGNIGAISLSAIATAGKINLVSSGNIQLKTSAVETAVAGTDLKNVTNQQSRLTALGDINIASENEFIFIEPTNIDSTAGNVNLKAKQQVHAHWNDNKTVANDNGNYRHDIVQIGTSIKGNNINIQSIDGITYFDFLNAESRTGSINISGASFHSFNGVLKAKQDINISARQEGIRLLEGNTSAERNIFIDTLGTISFNHIPSWASWTPSRHNSITATGLIFLKSGWDQDYRNTTLNGGGINIDVGHAINWKGNLVLWNATDNTVLGASSNVYKALNGVVNVKTQASLGIDPTILEIKATKDINLYSVQEDVNLIAGNGQVKEITSTGGNINVSGRSVTLSGASLIANKDVNVIAENGHVLLDNAVSLTSTTKNVNVAASKGNIGAISLSATATAGKINLVSSGNIQLKAPDIHTAVVGTDLKSVTNQQSRLIALGDINIASDNEFIWIEPAIIDSTGGNVNLRAKQHVQTNGRENRNVVNDNGNYRYDISYLGTSIKGNNINIQSIDAMAYFDFLNVESRIGSINISGAGFHGYNGVLKAKQDVVLSGGQYGVRLLESSTTAGRNVFIDTTGTISFNHLDNWYPSRHNEIRAAGLISLKSGWDQDYRNTTLTAGGLNIDVGHAINWKGDLVLWNMLGSSLLLNSTDAQHKALNGVVNVKTQASLGIDPTVLEIKATKDINLYSVQEDIHLKSSNGRGLSLSTGGSVNVTGRNITMDGANVTATKGINLVAEKGSVNLNQVTKLTSSTGDINIGAANGGIVTNGLSAIAIAGKINVVSGGNIDLKAIKIETAVAGTNLKNTKTQLSILKAGGDINLVSDNGNVWIQPATIDSTAGNVNIKAKLHMQTAALDEQTVINDNGNYRQEITAYAGSTISGNNINLLSSDWWVYLDLLNINARAGNLNINGAGYHSYNTTLKASQDINISARQEGIRLLEGNTIAGRNLFIDTTGTISLNHMTNWAPSRHNYLKAAGLISLSSDWNQDYRNTDIVGGGLNIDAGHAINWFGNYMVWSALGSSLLVNSTDAQHKALNGVVNVKTQAGLSLDPALLTVSATRDINLYSVQGGIHLLNTNDNGLKLTTPGNINITGQHITMDRANLTGTKGINLVANTGDINLNYATKLASLSGDINIGAANGGITSYSLSATATNGKINMVSRDNIQIKAPDVETAVAGTDLKNLKTQLTSLKAGSDINKPGNDINIVSTNGTIWIEPASIDSTGGNVNISGGSQVQGAGRENRTVVNTNGNYSHTVTYVGSTIKGNNINLSSGWWNYFDFLNAESRAGDINISGAGYHGYNTTLKASQDINISARQEGIRLLESNTTAGRNLFIDSLGTISLNHLTNWAPARANILTATGLLSLKSAWNQEYRYTTLTGGGVNIDVGDSITWLGNNVKWIAKGSALLSENSDAQLQSLDGAVNVKTQASLNLDPTLLTVTATKDINFRSDLGDVYLKNINNKGLVLSTTGGSINVSAKQNVTVDGADLKGAKGVGLSAENGSLTLNQSTKIASSAGDINISAVNGSITTTGLNVTAGTDKKINISAKDNIQIKASRSETIVSGTNLKNVTATQSVLKAGSDINIVSNNGGILLEPVSITITSGSINIGAKNILQAIAIKNLTVVNNGDGFKQQESYVGSTIKGSNLTLQSKDEWVHLDLVSLGDSSGAANTTNTININAAGIYGANLNLNAQQDINLYARQAGVTLLHSNATANRHLLIETLGGIVLNQAPSWAPDWTPSQHSYLTATTGLLSLKSSGNQEYRKLTLTGGGVNIESGDAINSRGDFVLLQAKGSEALKNNEDVQYSQLDGAVNVKSKANLNLDPKLISIIAAKDINLYSTDGAINLIGHRGNAGNGSEWVFDLNAINGNINLEAKSINIQGTTISASKSIKITSTEDDLVIDGIKNTFTNASSPVSIVNLQSRLDSADLEINQLMLTKDYEIFSQEMKKFKTMLEQALSMRSVSPDQSETMRKEAYEFKDKTINDYSSLVNTLSFYTSIKTKMQDKINFLSNKTSGYEHIGTTIASSTGDIKLTSAKGILVRASDLKSVLGKIDIEAHGVLNKSLTSKDTDDQFDTSILIDGVSNSYEVGQESDANYALRDFFKESNIIADQGVIISTVGNTAADHLIIQAANINSNNGNILLESNKDILLLSAQDESYDKSTNTTKKSTWYGKTKNSTTVSTSQTISAIPLELSAKNINIASTGGDVKLYSTNMEALGGKLDIKAQNIGLLVTDEVNKQESETRKKSTFAGFKYNDSTTNSSRKEIKQLPVKAKADYINTRSEFDTLIKGTEFTYLKAANIQAGGTITIEGASTTVEEARNRKSKSIVWQSVSGQGSTTQTINLPKFYGPNVPTINAAGGVIVNVPMSSIPTSSNVAAPAVPTVSVSPVPISNASVSGNISGQIPSVNVAPVQAPSFNVGSNVNVQVSGVTVAPVQVTNPSFNVINGVTIQPPVTSVIPGQTSNFNAGGGLTVQVPSQAGASNEVQQAVLALSNQPGNEYLKSLVNRSDVNWQPVKIAQESWSYEQEGLTPAGAALIGLALTFATGGVGASSVFGGSTAFNSAMLTLTNQATIGLINNGGDIGATLKELGSKDSIKSIVASAITAGIASQLNVVLPQSIAGNATAANIFNGMVTNTATNIASAIITGGDLSTAIESGLLSGLANGVQTALAPQISKLQDGTNLDMDYMLHKIAHAASGCITAAAQKKQCEAGAIGAAVSEVFAEALVGDRFDYTDKQLEDIKSASKGMASVVAAYTGYDVNTAANSAEITLQNNWLSTQQQKRLALEYLKANGLISATATTFEYMALSAKQDFLTLRGLKDGFNFGGPIEDIKALTNIALHPVDTFNGLKAIITDSEVRAKIPAAALDSLNQKIARMQSYIDTGGVSQAYNLGYDIGTLSYEALSVLAVIKEAGVVVAKLSKIGLNITQDMINAAKNAKAYEKPTLQAPTSQQAQQAINDLKTNNSQVNYSNCATSVSCFIAGTLVETKLGLKPIETLTIEDLILSRNEQTLEYSYQPISGMKSSKNQPIYEVAVKNCLGIIDIIYTTEEHPFWIKGNGWIKASLLLKGMELVDKNNQTLEVVSQKLIASVDTVYNIEVKNTHTYHVGKFGTWVHNACCNVIDGKFVFNNLLPERLADELSDAKRLGVSPVSVSSSTFKGIISEGTLKYAVTVDGQLLFVPKNIGGVEIKHSVLTNGKPVLSAGEVEIVSNGKGGYIAFDLDNRSGHFLNGATKVQNQVADQVAEAAFKANGFIVYKK